MKIIYVTNTRLPTEKAHGLATVKLCEAFAANGAEVTLFAPWRVNPIKSSVFEYYDVKPNFIIRFLPSFDFLWLGFGKSAFFFLQLFSFSMVAAFWLGLRYGLGGKLKNTVIFSHDHIPLFFASFFGRNIFYDIHDYPEQNLFYRRVLKYGSGFAVQTKWKVGKLREDFGMPESKIIYWPNGVDVGRFDSGLSLRAAREKLGLPQDKKIILYAGSLQRWKGVDTLVAAAELLSGDILVYVLGGSRDEIQEFRIKNSELRINFAGQKPWVEIPLWLKAADVLVLPNTAKEEISLHYTSPMKLFEYMASGRPIVASDIPSIREIADDAMIFFCRPDSPRSLAAAVEQALASPEEASRRTSAARREVQKYTWAARARRILAIAVSSRHFS